MRKKCYKAILIGRENVHTALVIKNVRKFAL